MNIKKTEKNYNHNLSPFFKTGKKTNVKRSEPLTLIVIILEHTFL